MNTPTSRPPIRVAFQLTDHHGDEVTEQSYRGGWIVVYFGFTHCKMVCPRALAKLSSALNGLGDDTETVTALYITVDPERDTPARMREFLQDDYPRFTGLTGTRKSVDEAKENFLVFTRTTADPDDPDDYAVPHTAMAYLINPLGECVDHFSDVVTAEEITRRLKTHINHANPLRAASE